ncbi:MAG: adenylate/guanylate cyclase domain-containing protein [Myxococcales bacterium]|nr:adenylate/guanylate cyclase domain-containing protein [Myxococcales bacterium]
MSELPDSLVVLFADLSGSTRLYDSLGDAPAREIVARCIDRIIGVVERHDGTVIKTIGDEVMSTFPGADAAADAAQDILVAMAEAYAIHQGRLGAHVGFHTGSVVHEAGDVFGDTVNLAARLVALAKRGEILTTRASVDALAPQRRERTRRIDRRELEGHQGALEIFELIAQTSNLTSMTPIPPAEPSGPGRLILRRGDGVFALDESRSTLSIGRDPESDLVLEDPQVSRRHARVRLRHGKFVLTDMSANGTLVRAREGKTVRLHREELILQGSGSIGFGRNLDGDGELPIAFFVEPDAEAPSRA